MFNKKIGNATSLIVVILVVILALGYAFYQVYTAAHNGGYYRGRNHWRESIIQEMKNSEVIETKNFKIKIKRVDGEYIIHLENK